METQYKEVQHFKIKPSQAFKRFKIALTSVAIILVVLSSIDIQFKVLLSLLLILEFIRQKNKEAKTNKINQFEVRENSVLIKRDNDNQLQSVPRLKIKQNRLFAELELQLEDELRYELLYHDRFESKFEFSSLLQNLRTIQRKINAHTNTVI